MLELKILPQIHKYQLIKTLVEQRRCFKLHIIMLSLAALALFSFVTTQSAFAETTNKTITHIMNNPSELPTADYYYETGAPVKLSTPLGDTECRLNSPGNTGSEYLDNMFDNNPLSKVSIVFSCDLVDIPVDHYLSGGKTRKISYYGYFQKAKTISDSKWPRKVLQNHFTLVMDISTWRGSMGVRVSESRYSGRMVELTPNKWQFVMRTEDGEFKSSVYSISK